MHTMNIPRTVALVAIPMLLIACSSDNGGDDAVGYTPMTDTEATAQQNAAAADKKIDPAKDAAETPAMLKLPNPEHPHIS